MGVTVSYNPDILSCLANLSNDEVFTPPELVNRILDMLPSELWSNPDTRVLDPCSKSGVFLREIAKRMLEGEKEAIPDLQQRIDHIFHNQLYGIAITELTSLLSRRSLYCSKFANGQYSVSHFDDTSGNIRYSNPKHSWGKDGSCIFCGASKSEYGRGEDAENYAYEFIHLTPTQIKELSDMHFDLIIGNPPYQLNDGGGNGASSKPIYQNFISQAKKLCPRFLVMITPSRWFSGGKGLDDFRDEMLHDRSLITIHDFPDATSVFPGVQIKGGVSYFLWDRDHKDDCLFCSHNGEQYSEKKRPLLEHGCETLIRYNEAIPILHKVQALKEGTMDKIVSSRMPFGLPNTYKGNKKRNLDTDLEIYVSGNDREIRGTCTYAPITDVKKGQDIINCDKVFIGKAGSGSDSFPHPILPVPFYGKPGTICNESYLVIGPFDSKKTCKNVISYISTKFFRFLVLLKKGTQNAAKGVYELVPMQDFSKPWTDEELYKKYDLTDDEIAFIESMIRPMDLSNDKEGGSV